MKSNIKKIGIKVYIEQIEPGHDEGTMFFGMIKKKYIPDHLCISNQPFYLGKDDRNQRYEQLARHPIDRPHNFKEHEWVEIDSIDGVVVRVQKINNQNEAIA